MTVDDIAELKSAVAVLSPHDDDADTVHPPNCHPHGRGWSPTDGGPTLQHHLRDAVPTATSTSPAWDSSVIRH